MAGVDRFPRCLALVLRQEGGFVNDPHDPGGATSMGITIGTLGDWRGCAVTVADVLALTAGEAGQIYRARYWNRLRCDDLPPGLDLMAFDAAVNTGPGTAARLLQRAVAAPVDGAVGPVTLAAAQAAELADAIDRMAEARVAHYRSIDGWPRYGKGWVRRTEEVRQAAQGMATERVEAPVVVVGLEALTARVAALEARLAAMARAAMG